MFDVVTFYQFTDWPDYAAYQGELKQRCLDVDLLGTILIASEGINATVAGVRSDLDDLISHIETLPAFGPLETKFSQTPTQPFRRMKVRLKREIVKLGVGEVDHTRTGRYVEPSDWNDLISDPDVVVIDARNTYEVEAGSFPRAIDPRTKSFGEFPAFVTNASELTSKPKVAMFCTGGIRCEKASAYLAELGFSEVYQLHGGILKYLEEMPPDQSLWDGECYVFDERTAVDRRSYPIDPG